jgi:pilus assembly protein CpaE
MFEQIISVGLAVKNQRVRDELREAIKSLKGFDVQNYTGSEGCDILVLDLGQDSKSEFQFVHSALNSGMAKEVFLTSARTDPEILIQAMRAGAKEFIVQPVKKDDVREALEKFSARTKGFSSAKRRQRMGKIITVMGVKGGVGTTTVAVNLASNLVETKGSSSVALVDMNPLFGEVPLFLDLKPAFSWAEIAKNISRLDSTLLMSVLSHHSSGVHVLSSPSQLDETGDATPDAIGKILGLMREEFDFTVIDSGHSLDDVTLKVIESSDTILVVSQQSLPCLVNVKRLLDAFSRLGYLVEERSKLIINRYQKKSVITLADVEKETQKKPFWLIPNDYTTTMYAINQGKPLSSVAHKVEISKSFRDLTLALAGKGDITDSNERKGILNWDFVSKKDQRHGVSVIS